MLVHIGVRDYLTLSSVWWFILWSAETITVWDQSIKSDRVNLAFILAVSLIYYNSIPKSIDYIYNYGLYIILEYIVEYILEYIFQNCSQGP